MNEAGDDSSGREDLRLVALATSAQLDTDAGERDVGPRSPFKSESKTRWHRRYHFV